jgi:uncharacterized damage-inducible protein DinB
MIQPEPWLRGPIPGIPPLLMPVAHALVMAREDVEAAISALSPDELWSRPNGAASAGFHAMHLAGSLDRLFTYARGEQLDDGQLRALEAEKSPEPPPSAAELVRLVHDTVDRALAQLRATDERTLLDPREVGRMKLPSNVLGLLFHAAEHTQRHVGQVVTTAKVVRGLASS